MMNKIIILLLGILTIIGCDTRIEPIEVVAPNREINTAKLQEYKSNLDKRNIVIGMLYKWGKQSQSNLMHTPDSLDIVVVKEGYADMTDFQKEDLKNVRTKKATKVLIGIDLEKMYKDSEKELEKRVDIAKKEKEKELKLSGETLSDEDIQKVFDEIKIIIKNEVAEEVKMNLEKLPSTIISIMKQHSFDGVSVEVSQSFNEAYSSERITKLLAAVAEQAGKEKDRILVVENPYQDAADIISKANWIIYKNTAAAALFSNFDEIASQWTASSFVPSVDFTKKDIKDGYKDSPNFNVAGFLPQTIDIINWNGTNKGGVAYYHIEENYNDIVGEVTYTTLRYAINKMQLTNK